MTGTKVGIRVGLRVLNLLGLAVGIESSVILGTIVGMRVGLRRLTLLGLAVGIESSVIIGDFVGLRIALLTGLGVLSSVDVIGIFLIGLDAGFLVFGRIAGVLSSVNVVGGAL